MLRDINITPVTKDELERLATNIPEMDEVTVHTLNNKLQEINNNILIPCQIGYKLCLLSPLP